MKIVAARHAAGCSDYFHLQQTGQCAARWEGFDRDAVLSTIPAQRTKMREEHRVPLSKQGP